MRLEKLYNSVSDKITKLRAEHASLVVSDMSTSGVGTGRMKIVAFTVLTLYSFVPWECFAVPLPFCSDIFRLPSFPARIISLSIPFLRAPFQSRSIFASYSYGFEFLRTKQNQQLQFLCNLRD